MQGRREAKMRAGDRRAVEAGAAPSDRLIVRLWAAAVALATWACGFTSMLNSALWFHLAAGRGIVRPRAITHPDSRALTAAGRPWHNQEWLADVVFFAWSRLASVEALVFW